MASRKKKSNSKDQAPAEASSSLGRDAKRVIRENDSKLKRSKLTRLAYDPANMAAAVEAIQKKQMSVRAAADYYNVPASTAGKKANGVGCGVIGSPYVLSEAVEQELADMIRSYCSSGNVMEKEFFKEIVKKYARLLPSARKKEFKCSEEWIC